jgi:hypothetical protein
MILGHIPALVVQRIRLRAPAHKTLPLVELPRCWCRLTDTEVHLPDPFEGTGLIEGCSMPPTSNVAASMGRQDVPTSAMDFVGCLAQTITIEANGPDEQGLKTPNVTASGALLRESRADASDEVRWSSGAAAKARGHASGPASAAAHRALQRGQGDASAPS